MVQGPFTTSPITRWTYDLLNAGFLQKGDKANRPTSSVRTNRMMYWAEDTGEVLWSNGTNSGNDLGDGWGIAVAVDPAANVGGLRTLGSGALQGAPGPHVHNSEFSVITPAAGTRYIVADNFLSPVSSRIIDDRDIVLPAYGIAVVSMAGEWTARRSNSAYSIIVSSRVNNIAAGDYSLPIGSSTLSIEWIIENTTNAEVTYTILVYAGSNIAGVSNSGEYIEAESTSRLSILRGWPQ